MDLRVSLVLVCCVIVLAFSVRAQAEGKLSRVLYEPTDAIFINPERGFYMWTDATVPISAPAAGNLQPAVLRSARLFPDGYSLIIRLYNLHLFRDKELTQAALDFIQTDFDRLREAGIKAIVLFRYSTVIGDPDAPLEIVLRHIEQLAPVLQENYDVIAVMKAGFIGAWGEWHASTHNLTDLENKRAILFKLLDALPPERMVLLRYPSDKIYIFETEDPLTPEQAYDGSYFARTGHHNDCFLASETDVGTYRISVTWEKEYLHLDTRYVPMGGETCRVREGERYRSETALKELEQLRWSFINSSYYKGTLDTWRAEGSMDEIQRRLGYRFALIEGEFTPVATRSEQLFVRLGIKNEGWAAPFNPRGLEIVMRNMDSGSIHVFPLPDDPRLWLGGETVVVAADLQIPDDMPVGEYQLLLHLPDPAERLYGRPEYSIRLANEGVWEANTGFNRLHMTVEVRGE